MSINLGSAFLYFQGDTKQLNRVLKSLKRDVATMVGGAADLAKKALLGVTAGIVGGGVAAFALTKRFAETGDALEEMSQRTGIGVQALSEYKFALEDSGSSLEGFETSIKKMEKSIAEAGDETAKSGAKQQQAHAATAAKIRELTATFPKFQREIKQAQQRYAEMVKSGTASASALAAQRNKIANLSDAFSKAKKEVSGLSASMVKGGAPVTGPYTEALKKLGLTYGELKTLSPEKQFELIATRLADVKDQSTKTQIAIDLFGRSGTSLIPILQGGEAGLAALRAEAQRTGNTFSEVDAKAGGQFKTNWGLLQQAISGVSNEIARALIPTFNEYIPQVTNAVIQLRKWIQEKANLRRRMIELVAYVKNVLIPAMIDLYQNKIKPWIEQAAKWAAEHAGLLLTVGKTVAAFAALSLALSLIAKPANAAVLALRIVLNVLTLIRLKLITLVGAKAAGAAVSGVGAVACGGLIGLVLVGLAAIAETLVTGKPENFITRLVDQCQAAKKAIDDLFDVFVKFDDWFARTTFAAIDWTRAAVGLSRVTGPGFEGQHAPTTPTPGAPSAPTPSARAAGPAMSVARPTSGSPVTISGNTFVVRQQSDISAIGQALYDQVKSRMMARGVVY